MSERLETIKNNVEFLQYEQQSTNPFSSLKVPGVDALISKQDFDFLIEQAEVLEKVRKELDRDARSTSELEQQNERYREALEFYANQSNWMNIEVPTMMDGEPEMVTREPLIFDDGGRKAREALEEPE